MPITKEDKLKTANWFRDICIRIMSCQWPEEDLPYVRSRVAHFMETAQALEKEALKGMHLAEIH